MISLPREPLHLTDVRAVATGTKVSLSPAGHRRIGQAHQTIVRILNDGKPVYGVNTGFGALADKTIPLAQITELQHNLLKSHAVGTGETLRPEEVRAVMFLRANMLSKGFSGVRCKLVEQIVELLNRGVVPVVYEFGSVGASGDLAPLAHLALVAVGQGEAFYHGRRMSGKAALKAAGLAPYELRPKEGLSFINGTEVMAGVGTLVILRAEQLAAAADLAGALTAAAVGANPRVFEPDLHRVKPYAGQQASALVLRNYLKGADYDRARIQDAYSIRCMPQVHGAAREGIAFAHGICTTEINSVTDNPVLMGDTAISGGNFHGSAIALGLDTLAIALTQLATISERRTFRLLDAHLSGLPPFLMPDPGVNSGLMIAQMLAATLVTECKLLAAPASVHSLPTSAGQEDYVSMGMNSTLKARRITGHLTTILAVEILCAAQGLELSGRPIPPGLKVAFRKIRRVVPFMPQDREVHTDIAAVAGLLPSLVAVRGTPRPPAGA